MSPTLQNRPTVALFPSSLEDVNAYMAAIRLASSVRNTMEAPKADVDREEVAVNADSYGRHHANFPPLPAEPVTPEERNPVPVLNQTSSAHFASNTTKPGLVDAQDSNSLPSHSMNKAHTPNGPSVEALTKSDGHLLPPELPTPTSGSPEAKDTAAVSPTGVKLETLEQHHGRFPPPEPPIGSTQAPPGMSMSKRDGPLPIEQTTGDLPDQVGVPGGVTPQCQLYVTNTDVNMTFAVCPVTQRNNHNISHDLAGQQLNPRDAFSSHILAIRNTPMCKAPTSSKERLACGQYDACFVVAFFIFFSLISFAWMMRTWRRRSQPLDPEDGNGAWPSPSHPSTNSSAAKLKAKVRETSQRDRRSEDSVGAEPYQPVGWRSASQRAARANFEGRVNRDAGPVAVLPEMFVEHLPDCPFAGKLPTSPYGSTCGNLA